MLLGDMIRRVNSLIDETAITSDLVDWFNDAKRLMEIAIKADFPDITLTTGLDDTFVFPSKYCLIPVLYGAAKFKEKDVSLQEAGNFMSQFDRAMKDFTAEYVPPVQYRDDRLSQQFTATAGQTTFTITKDGYPPSYGDLKVYINGIRTFDFSTDNTPSFNLTNLSVDGDRVTAIWEEHMDLIDPPYNWWTW